MFNYVKAELWKLTQRPALFLTWGILFLLMVVYSVLLSGREYSNLVAACTVVLVAGVLVAPLLVMLVDDGASDTLKHEVAFGLSRTRIYLGKLVAVLLAGLALCAILLGACLIGGWLLLNHSDPEQEWTNLAVLGFSVLGAVPIWCGMAGVCHMAALAIRNTAVWICGYYIYFFFGQPILLVFVAILFAGDTSSWAATVAEAVFMPSLLLTPRLLSGWLIWTYQVWCWGVGLGWLAASTAAGLALLKRKDIR